mmetsp:Transcript_95150/g.268858  ORF Transcript_95150/g.268858 Transcript_95150/m.268858 type:complete len:425 (-) Transcript_95150:134-1408(-)
MAEQREPGKRKRDMGRTDVDDGRHFRHEFNDSTEPAAWREIVEPAFRRAMDTVRQAYSVHSSGSAASSGKRPKPSVYTGDGGVAYSQLHLARRGHDRSGDMLLDACQRLRASERLFDSRRVTFLEGAAGNVALQACGCHMRGDRGGERDLTERLGRLAQSAMDLEPGECEVLYGRCGFLGAVLALRHELGDDRLLSKQAAKLVAQVVRQGKRGACDGFPLYYEWHEKCYYGGAHGLAGILLTLLQLPAELEAADPEALDLVRGTGDRLLQDRFPSGSMPSSRGSTHDRLVHWCHGATGFVPLLLRMAIVYREPRYARLAAEFGEVVWRRGLLSTKGLGLCHGTPGNGYALLALYRDTGDALWLRRAQHFALFAASNAEKLTPLADRPYSLFEGLAGAVCFWADVLHVSGDVGRVVDIRFPCYEF